MVAKWPCGFVAMWLWSYVSAQLCGSMAMWLYGAMALRLYGNMVMVRWLYPYAITKKIVRIPQCLLMSRTHRGGLVSPNVRASQQATDTRLAVWAVLCVVLFRLGLLGEDPPLSTIVRLRASVRERFTCG